MVIASRFPRGDGLRKSAAVNARAPSPSSLRGYPIRSEAGFR